MYNGSITANAVTPSVNMKNRIINGAMTLNQRGFSGSNSNNTYTLDRWVMQTGLDNKFTVAQSSTAPTGFSNSLLVTSSTAYSVPSGEYYTIVQKIEGFNTADLAFGTASAKTVTLSFQVYSSLTGTFGGSLANSANNRSYPFTYTISTANTWTTASVTIAGDTSGTWIGATNGIGLNVIFGLGVGTTYSGTAGAWAGADYRSATGAVSVVGTNGATFYITGVQLEVGSTATSFDYRPYTTELGLCYRYCYALYKGDNIYYATAGYYTSTDVRTQIQMPVNMRTTPTISYTGYSMLWRNGTSDANNVNGWSVTLSCPNTVHLTSTNSMSGTAGQIGWLYGAGGGQLIFLAEL
jgi:hypothetical protein